MSGIGYQARLWRAIINSPRHKNLKFRNLIADCFTQVFMRGRQFSIFNEMVRKLTNEFSVILNLKKEWTGKINEARKYLPPSPVRTDRPHMTLLRAVTSTEFRPDEELIKTIQPYALRLPSEDLKVTVAAIQNQPSALFGPTGVVVVEVP